MTSKSYEIRQVTRKEQKSFVACRQRAFKGMDGFASWTGRWTALDDVYPSYVVLAGRDVVAFASPIVATSRDELRLLLLTRKVHEVPLPSLVITGIGTDSRHRHSGLSSALRLELVKLARREKMECIAGVVRDPRLWPHYEKIGYQRIPGTESWILHKSAFDRACRALRRASRKVTLDKSTLAPLPRPKLKAAYTFAATTLG